MRRSGLFEAMMLAGIIMLGLAAVFVAGKADAIQPGDYSPTGPDFLVNTTTEGYQCCSRVAALAEGGFVVVWLDNSQTGSDTSSGAIRAQRYAADGTRAGVEFLVNTTTEDHQFEPAVAALRGGGFVVVWTSRESGGRFHIRGRIFNASGQGVGGFNHAGAPAPGDFQVNDPVNNVNTTPHVAGFDAGGFVVVWSRQGRAIHARRFLPTGQPVGAEIIVSEAPGSNFSCTNAQLVHIQCWPRVATLADGGFVVTWSDASHSQSDQSGAAVFARGYNSSGVPTGDEIQVNDTIYGADDMEGNQSAGAIARTPDGVVIVWSSWRADLPDTRKDYDIHARRYHVSSGGLSALGNAFRVNTYTQGREVAPSIAQIPDGGYLVVWQDDRTDTAQQLEHYDIRAQLFNNNFELIDGEFTVNTTWRWRQETPSVVRWGERGIVVTFTSDAGPTPTVPGVDVPYHPQNYHIRARLYERACDTDTAYAEGGECLCRIYTMVPVSATACACPAGTELGVDPATGRPACVPRSCDPATTVQVGRECQCLSADMERVDEWSCACPGIGRLSRIPGRPWRCIGEIEGTRNPVLPGGVRDAVIGTSVTPVTPFTPAEAQRSGAGPGVQPCPPRHVFSPEHESCMPLACTPPMRLNEERTECVCPAGQELRDGVCRETGRNLDRAIEILAPVIRDGGRPPSRDPGSQPQPQPQPQPNPNCTPGGPVPC